MNIAVLLKQVPDLVEELEVDETGKELDRSWLRFVLNEFDDHALEQALLLKEQHGGCVTVLALDRGEVNETLFTALAKGADSAIKITGNFDGGVDSHTAARIFELALQNIPHDLILTGVQSSDDLDGQVGAILASYLRLPYVGVVSGIRINEGLQSTVKKEFPGGILSEITTKLPALLGIQASAKPPRYIPIARLRQTMKTSRIVEVVTPLSTGPTGFRIRRMFKPEAAEHAEMISGSREEIVNRIVGILSERGLVR